jgi:hypothetical protein
MDNGKCLAGEGKCRRGFIIEKGRVNIECQLVSVWRIAARSEIELCPHVKRPRKAMISTVGADPFQI